MMVQEIRCANRIEHRPRAGQRIPRLESWKPLVGRRRDIQSRQACKVQYTVDVADVARVHVAVRILALEIGHEKVAHELWHVALDFDSHGRIAAAFSTCVGNRLDEVVRGLLVEGKLAAARDAER